MSVTQNTPATEKTPMARRFRGFLPVVVDVETGGFNADTDALLEIAMVTLRMDDQGLLHPHESMSANIPSLRRCQSAKRSAGFYWH